MHNDFTFPYIVFYIISWELCNAEEHRDASCSCRARIVQICIPGVDVSPGTLFLNIQSGQSIHLCGNSKGQTLGSTDNSCDCTLFARGMHTEETA